MTAEELFLKHLDLIEEVISFVCRRWRLSNDQGEDFASLVRLRLIEKDYAVIRKFRGRSSLRTYLTAVIQRLALDYRVQQQGRWRPSAAAQRLGPEAERLERLLYHEELTREAAVELLLQESFGRSREDLLALASQLPPRPSRKLEDDQRLAELPAPQTGAEDELLDREQATQRDACLAALRRAMAELSAQDRLILQLRFTEEYKVADVARVLQLEAKPLYRHLERLLAQLRQALRQEGLGRTDPRDLLRS